MYTHINEVCYDVIYDDFSGFVYEYTIHDSFYDGEDEEHDDVAHA